MRALKTKGSGRKGRLSKQSRVLYIELCPLFAYSTPLTFKSRCTMSSWCKWFTAASSCRMKQRAGKSRKAPWLITQSNKSPDLFRN